MDQKLNTTSPEDSKNAESQLTPKQIGLKKFLNNQKAYLIFAGIFLVGLPLLLTATLATTRLISRASYKALVMTPITPPTPTVSTTPTPLVTPTCVPRPSCLDQRVPCRIKITPGTIFCPKPTPTCVPRPSCLDQKVPCRIKMVPGTTFCPKPTPTKVVPTRTLPTKTLPTRTIPTNAVRQ